MLGLGVDAPTAVHVHQPLAARFHARRAGESRTHGVEERLREVVHVGLLHARGPDRSENWIIAGELLRPEERSGRHGGGQEAKHVMFHGDISAIEKSIRWRV